MKLKSIQMIEVSDFDKLVSDTYGKPYNFQQQDDCKPRGIYEFSLPNSHPYDYERDSVPETVNHPDMGVSFKAWLERDPDQKLNAEDWDSPSALKLWWDRNFYPCVDMILNDLHKKGLLKDGDYVINIDW